MRVYRIAVWILLLSSCASNHETKPKPEKKAEPKKPRITHFYANAPMIARGETVTLCYGTENADSVQLTPYDDELRPSLNRCVGANPVKDTTFTLAASSPLGTETQSVTVRVGAAATKPPAEAAERQLIQNFQYLGRPTVQAGARVQLCYTTVGASSVSVSPAVGTPLKPGNNQCFAVTVQKSTNYILTARADDGAVDRMQVTIPVQ
jgi:hypothetical protein